MAEIKLKICGLMRREDVLCCGENGVDIAGFVTEYPVPVPWNISRKEAAWLMQHVPAEMTSCIVTGGSPEKILSLVLELRPGLVQLHYHESISDTRYLVQKLLPYGVGIIKTLPTQPEERKRQFGTENVADCIRMLNDSGVHSILLDRRGPDGVSEESRNTIASTMAELSRRARVPVILAGGITACNVMDLCRSLKPDIIDLMTGVELSPGVKEHDKIRQLTVCLAQYRKESVSSTGV